MDGLDTYDRILAVRPGQKAIIASGYAETGRVHEALQRGPAAYLKKPYRLENLAEALKTVGDIDTAS
jgi:DNA-binding NarL/FixJ family response regulator